MYIYIILSYTGSMPAKIIRKATKCHYSHVSISKDPSLSSMYSFGRKYNRLPYPGGFIKENINCGLFNLNQNDEISVYRLLVSKKQFKDIDKEMVPFLMGINDYFYDIKGAVGLYFNINLFRENGYICSSFVNELLTNIGIQTSKPSWQMQPEDFLDINDMELIYEGNSSNYNNYINEKSIEALSI